MSIGSSLSRLALQRLVDDVFATGGAEALDGVVDFLTRCGQDRGARLTGALDQALERAWRALEVALADDPFWDRGQVGLDPANARAFRQRVETVLVALSRGGGDRGQPGLTAVETSLRQQCLWELRAGREAGTLGGSLDAGEWARSHEVFARFAVSGGLLESQRRTEGELIRALERQGCVGLARMLTSSAALPSLVMVVRAFFCQTLGGLLRWCLQESPERTPANGPLVMEIFRELTYPRFSARRPQGGTRAPSAAPVVIVRPPLPVPRRAAAGMKPRSRQSAHRRPAVRAPAAGANQPSPQPRGRRIEPPPVAGRSPWTARRVLALGLLAFVVLSLSLVVAQTRQQSAEQRRVAAQRQRLTKERRRLDQKRQHLVREQRRRVEERAAQEREAELQRQEMERRRLAEAEKARLREEERAARQRDEERKLREEQRLARLREEKERREKAGVILERALTHAALRRDEAALADFTEVLTLEPTISRAWTERGLVRRRLLDNAGALADFNEAIRRDPRDARAWYNRGELHVAEHSDSEAIDDFTAVLRLEPGNALAYRERGACRLRQGDYPRAIDDETVAIRLAPRDPLSYYHRAEAHRRSHDIEAALVDYSAAIDRDRGRDPALVGAYRARGLILLDRREYGKAIDDLTRALESDAEDVAVRQARGLAYLKDGSWNKAILDADTVIARDPQNVEAYKLRGQAHLELHEHRKAHQDFTRAIRLHRDAEAYYLRARTKAELGDLAEAIYDCNDAAALNPRLADAFFLRGTLRIRGGNLARGLADRRTAHKLDPRFPLP